MAKIQLLSGPAVDEALETTAVRSVFRYKLNPATIGGLLVLGGASFVIAAYLWFGPGLGGATTVGFFACLAMGITFFSMGSYWDNFRNKRFIAVSDDYLFVGKDLQAWRIHWSLVNRETLNLDDMKSSRLRGKFHLDAAGQSVEIPLYTPFVFLDDIEGMMFELLQRLEVDGGEAPAGAPGCEAGTSDLPADSDDDTPADTPDHTDAPAEEADDDDQ